MRVPQQIVLVTGASRGIGRTTAETFAREGAKVMAVARNADALGTLEGPEGSIETFVADVCDREAMTAVATRVLETHGPPDLIVANAGRLGPIGPTVDADPENWWRDVEVNLRGNFLSFHPFLEAMTRSGHGRIVLFGGGGSTRPFPWASAYGMSKAAILRLAETLDLELEGTGVSVFSLSPGFVRTDMTERFATTPDGRKYAPGLAERLDQDDSTPPGACAELLLRIAEGDLDALHGRFLHAGLDLDRLEDLRARAEEIAEAEERVLRLKGFSL